MDILSEITYTGNEIYKIIIQYIDIPQNIGL